MSPTQTIYSSHTYTTITPLATIWTPPASCITPVPTIFAGHCFDGRTCSPYPTTGSSASYYESTFIAWANYAYWTSGYSQVNVDCYPPGYQNVAGFSFSPARGCPGGYTTAQSYTDAYYSDVTVACCPPGYPDIWTFTSGDLACYRSVTRTGESFQVGAYGTIDQVDTNGVTQDWYATFSSMGSTTLNTLPTDPVNLDVYVQAIQMVVPSSWNLAAATGTATTTYDPYYYPTATGTPLPSGSYSFGLSLSALIGIGIGSFLLFCICPCLTCWCFKRRPRRLPYLPQDRSYPNPVPPAPVGPYTRPQIGSPTYPPAPLPRPNSYQPPAPVQRPNPVPARKCFKNPPCASSKECSTESCCLCKDFRTKRMPLSQRLTGAYYCLRCREFWRQQPKDRLPWLMPIVEPPAQVHRIPQPRTPQPRSIPRRQPKDDVNSPRIMKKFIYPVANKKHLRVRRVPKSSDSIYAGMQDDGPKYGSDTILYPRAKRRKPKRKRFLSSKAPETNYAHIQDQGPKTSPPGFDVLPPGILNNRPSRPKNRTSTSFDTPLPRPFIPTPITLTSYTTTADSLPPVITDYAQIHDEGPKSTAPTFQVPVATATAVPFQSRNPFRRGPSSPLLDSPPSLSFSGPSSLLSDSASSLSSRVPSSSTLRSPSIGAASSVLDSSSSIGSPRTAASSSAGASRATSPDAAEGRRGRYASLRYEGPKFDDITKGL